MRIRFANDQVTFGVASWLEKIRFLQGLLLNTNKQDLEQRLDESRLDIANLSSLLLSL